MNSTSNGNRNGKGIFQRIGNRVVNEVVILVEEEARVSVQGMEVAADVPRLQGAPLPPVQVGVYHLFILPVHSVSSPQPVLCKAED